jgi:hypothetical protein
MPGQVRLQQIVRDELDLPELAAEAAHQLADRCTQGFNLEDVKRCHQGLLLSFMSLIPSISGVLEILPRW